MLRIRPFVALRPPASQASRVASPPYDVVSTEEARAMAAGNPWSFLHVIRPEIDLPDGTSPYDDAVYAKARENFDRLIAEGALLRDDQPRLYLYRQALQHKTQIGLVACCHVDDYLRGVIKKHENTRRDKEDDRTRHTLTINANAGPVFLTYRDTAEVDAAAAADVNERPLYHFNAPDGVTHTIWAVPDPDPYIRAMGRLDAAYVADGHHRSASAARAAETRRAANPNHTGDEAYNWFLCVLFPASQLTILPYNRVVRDLRGREPAEILRTLGEVAAVTPSDDPRPNAPGTFCLYLDGAWHRCAFDPASIDRSDPIRSLDVSLVQERVLEPVFGIGDVRTDPRIDFVGGGRGPQELERRVREGRAAAAFSLFPTTIEQLLAVADAGLIMPPKSTWFEPKLRSGLLVHELG